MGLVHTVDVIEDVGRLRCERDIVDGDIEMECKFGIDKGGMGLVYDQPEYEVSRGDVDPDVVEHVKNGSHATQFELDRATCTVTGNHPDLDIDHKEIECE